MVEEEVGGLYPGGGPGGGAYVPMGAIGEVGEVMEVTLGLEVTPRVTPGAAAVVEVEMAGAGTPVVDVGRFEEEVGAVAADGSKASSKLNPEVVLEAVPRSLCDEGAKAEAEAAPAPRAPAPRAAVVAVLALLVGAAAVVACGALSKASSKSSKAAALLVLLVPRAATPPDVVGTPARLAPAPPGALNEGTKSKSLSKASSNPV